MKSNELQAALEKSVIFEGVSPEILEEIKAVAVKKVFEKNAIVKEIGTPYEGCHIILSGKVEVANQSKKGSIYVLTRLGPGDSFGEVSLLTAERAPAFVKAVEKTQLLLIPRQQFTPILLSHAVLLDALGKTISRWYKRTSSALEKEADLRVRLAPWSLLDFLLIMVLAGLCAIIFNKTSPKGIPLFPTSELDKNVLIVSPQQAYEKLKSDQAVFLDAMPTGFHEKKSIPGAINLPPAIFDFMYDLTMVDIDKSKPIVVYGHTISRHYDEEVANKLVLKGHKKIALLKGGLRKWKNEGFSVKP